MATTPTNIQDAVSKGSKKAVGEMIPVRLTTTIAIPVSMKGTLKSTCKNLLCVRYVLCNIYLFGLTSTLIIIRQI